MRAAKSAAWIAADDALDAWIALEGGRTPDQDEVLDARLQLVDSSLAALLPLVDEGHRSPPLLVRSLASDIRHCGRTATQGALTARLLARRLSELEALHDLWSPVPRLPTVPGS